MERPNCSEPGGPESAYPGEANGNELMQAWGEMELRGEDRRQYRPGPGLVVQRSQVRFTGLSTISSVSGSQ
jgi:hypothetical protein